MFRDVSSAEFMNFQSTRVICSAWARAEALQGIASACGYRWRTRRLIGLRTSLREPHVGGGGLAAARAQARHHEESFGAIAAREGDVHLPGALEGRGEVDDDLGEGS